jgi:hypothetical protein
VKYFLDTEFIENGKTIDLISIAIVAEDGREFYAESTEVNWMEAGEWVMENVVPHLWHRQRDKSEYNAWMRDGGTGGLMPRSHMRGEILGFCDPKRYGKPEFWGYYADYDWVVFCWLFGRMIDLPKGYPMYCRDLKQWADDLGGVQLPKQETTEHHALADARWNRSSWEYLDGFNAVCP